MDNSSSNDIVNYLCNRYYALVEHLETLEEKHKVRMDFASCLQNLSLGEVVDINDGLYDNYVITRMHGTFSYSESADGINSHDTSFHKAEGVPVLTNRPDEKGVINPIVDDLPRVVVPPKARSASGTESASRVVTSSGGGAPNDANSTDTLMLQGFVADNADPLKMNRVKVRYTFVGGTETTSTEWIPVMVPFSGTNDGGGITMTLEKNERVLIWMENKKPQYVMGSIYVDEKNVGTNLPDLGYKDNVPATYKVGRKIHTIASSNGHAITFLDKPDNGLLASKIPILKTVLSCMRLQGKENNFTKAVTKAGNIKGGGVIISDGSCLCTVELNADKQAIDIHSDFGTVGISAFTGITVNAPNGDITIKGKNVSIEAGNNLSIKAGTNIKSKSNIASSISLGVGAAAAGMLTSYLSSVKGVDLTNLIDVSYIRSFLEIFYRPVEGTLSIQSNRNVLMTAGAGKVSIPSTLLSEKKKTDSPADKDGKNAIFSLKIANCINEVNHFLSGLSEQRDALISRRESILFSYDRLPGEKVLYNKRIDMVNSLNVMAEHPDAKDQYIKNEYLNDDVIRAWYDCYCSEYGALREAFVKYKDDLMNLSGLKAALTQRGVQNINLDNLPSGCKKFTNAAVEANTNLSNATSLIPFYDVSKKLKRAVLVRLFQSLDDVKFIINHGGSLGKKGDWPEGNYQYLLNKNELDAYIAPGDLLHPWNELCDALFWTEKEKGKFDNFDEKYPIGSDALFGTIGGITSVLGIGDYDAASGKWKPVPSFMKLFDIGGVAGPRSFDEISTKGNILISNASGTSLSLNSDTTGWTSHKNLADTSGLVDLVKSFHLE